MLCHTYPHINSLCNVLFSLYFSVDGIQFCFCTVCDELYTLNKSACELKPLGKCYTSVELPEDGGPPIKELGCLPPEEGSILQVSMQYLSLLYDHVPSRFLNYSPFQSALPALNEIFVSGEWDQGCQSCINTSLSNHIYLCVL